MTAPQKFLFDQSFDKPDALRARSRAAAAPPLPEPTFSRAELEAALAAGVAEARDAALAEARKPSEGLALGALTSLTAGIGELLLRRQH
jgi:hypothetical protein